MQFREFVYFMFGPVVGGVYGGVLDLIQYVVKPTGAFFPGFTLNAILAGILYGTLLYQRPLSFKRTLAAHLVVILLCNVFLNTLWLSMMSGKAITLLLPMRLIKNIIMWPIDTTIFYLIAKKWNQPESSKPSANLKSPASKPENVKPYFNQPDTTTNHDSNSLPYGTIEAHQDQYDSIQRAVFLPHPIPIPTYVRFNFPPLL